MQYLLIIHGDETARKSATPADQKAMFAMYEAYTAEIKKAGVWRAGQALELSANGARVTVRGGKRSVVDGPFIETKEVVGGFYLIECATKEEATEWAAKCPGAQHGTMEVRAIMQLPY